MAKKGIKRKTSESKDTLVEDSKPTKQIQNEDLLQHIDNASGDSTDDEGIDQAYNSDDSDDLEYESDYDGNYAAKNTPEEDKDSSEKEQSSDDESYQIEDISGDDEDDNEEEEEESEIVPFPKKVATLKKARKQKELKAKNTPEEVKDSSEKEQSSDEESYKIEDISDDDEEDNEEEEEEEAAIVPVPKKVASLKKTRKQKELMENPSTSFIEHTIPTSAQTAHEEYENSDTSDEEDIRNTVGNIPMHWYDEYKHIGYDWDGKKIIKPKKGDQIDEFLRKIEDPDFWRTVKDPQTGQDVILSDADIALIKRINSARVPNAEHNEYEPWIEWFTSEVEKMPIKNVPDHKRSFLPSVSEKKKVSRMVHALKMGWMKTTAEVEAEKRARRGPKFYMLWESDTTREQMRRIHDPVSAPKRDLPGHAESYNPPPEYLFDQKERKEWLKLREEPHKRKLHFMPQQYRSLREVPAYPRFLHERFLRCLDLYLCPRAKRVKLNIDAEYLIPKLPSPKDLQPFPTVESLVYQGHTDLVRTISVEPKGEYLVSGSDDKTVKSMFISTFYLSNVMKNYFFSNLLLIKQYFFLS